ncbi:MAG: family lipolytic protein [Verrucomicrobiaceae bacterium]|nr:family lipolytic protein [Verrucomicrobiaceae bacterium]
MLKQLQGGNHPGRLLTMPVSRFPLVAILGLLSVSLRASDDVPAFTQGAHILFQGDSITDGNRGRTADPNHILGHGYQFIIAAKYGAVLAERDLTFINRGISGNTVLDLENRWQKDTLELKPDLLSILIGVNDDGKNVSMEQYEQVYDKLLTGARAANPQVKLVLGEPFRLWKGDRPGNWEAAIATIRQRQAIVAKLAAKHGAALVHFQAVFDEAVKRAPASHWIWDGVHPTYSGHQLMADEWVRVVKAFWK